MKAIQVENLSKSYLVGHNNARAESYTALRDVLARNARNLARKTRDMLTGRQIVQGDEVEEFWALKDINFEIQQGDRVGIIGRNGAGKSTLLKILSRITEPTTGRVTINGRVASLLEVGTGFHPELTGRENVFLNGAILGMGRKEIQRKFDEIVDFAEVEKFLDTPVKRYSSGMYVRLAFAVAAHLEPEILIVDEVLAVGDVQFQKKCLGKMDDVASNGRTVLFVSHNIDAILSLCKKGFLLDEGKLICSGDAVGCANKYMMVGSEVASCLSWVNGSGLDKCQDYFTVISFEVHDNGVPADSTLFASKLYTLSITIEIATASSDIRLAFGVYGRDGKMLILSSANDGDQIDFDKIGVGVKKITSIVPAGLLEAGDYYIELLSLVECNAWVHAPNNQSRMAFKVVRDDNKNPHVMKPLGGVEASIHPVLTWEVV